MQAYKLYRLGVKIAEEEMAEMLNDHLNKMEAASAFVQQRLKMRPEYSFEEEEKIIEKQHVPVIFEGMSGKDLFIETERIGLSRDCPEDELAFWNTRIREKQVSIDKFIKAPRRSIDRASQFMKKRVESFVDDEYELDKF